MSTLQPVKRSDTGTYTVYGDPIWVDIAAVAESRELKGWPGYTHVVHIPETEDADLYGWFFVAEEGE